MRTEIEKYHLRVITVDGLIKMWLAYYGILIHYFSQPQMHHKKKKKETHELPTVFIKPQFGLFHFSLWREAEAWLWHMWQIS